MRLFIAEKPELARAIVEALGGGTNKRSHYECANNDVVTFCYGHMLSLKDPEDYDPAYSTWSMSQLPMSFIPWQYKPNPKSEDQLNAIIALLGKSSSVVHAGDPDPEGQLLVDEILNYVGYTKPVSRVLINDLNLRPVKLALANAKDNSDFKGLSLAAEARSVGDQLYGYNLTRCYSLAAQNEGYQGVMSLGRVQTPVLGLIVRRDLEHEAHVKSYFYTLTGNFTFDGLTIPAKYKPTENDPVDESGRITSADFAKQLSDSVTGHSAKITSAKTSGKQEKAPLPYNLLKLQTDASRKFGLKPDRVKDVTQSLREKHKLITYNRSDCQYLGDDHFEAAPGVLDAISKTAPALTTAATNANPKIKSRAFNASKVTAHHAIIPTENTADFSALTNDEQRIYMLIARAYIAQFYPSYEYNETAIAIECSGNSFACTARVGTKAGWKSLYKNDAGNEEVETEGDSLATDLSALKVSANGQCVSCANERKETAPPKRYTIDTLLNDLTRIAKYISDPKLKALLIEKDKGKEGEHGGIGTPATRDTIIAGLFERGFVTEQGKSLVSTKVAREFYSALPDVIRFPDMTAIWHEQQLQIENGTLQIGAFIDGLMSFISEEVAKVKEHGVKGLTIQKHQCPKCTKLLRRINGTKGPFWTCTGFSEGCKTTFNDVAGKPQIVHQKPTAISAEHKCTTCGTGLRRIRGSAAYIWVCGKAPTCRQSYPDKNAVPDLAQPKIK